MSYPDKDWSAHGFESCVFLTGSVDAFFPQKIASYWLTFGHNSYFQWWESTVKCIDFSCSSFLYHHHHHHYIQYGWNPPVTNPQQLSLLSQPHHWDFDCVVIMAFLNWKDSKVSPLFCPPLPCGFDHFCGTGRVRALPPNNHNFVINDLLKVIRW